MASFDVACNMWQAPLGGVHVQRGAAHGVRRGLPLALPVHQVNNTRACTCLRVTCRRLESEALECAHDSSAGSCAHCCVRMETEATVHDFGLRCVVHLNVHVGHLRTAVCCVLSVLCVDGGVWSDGCCLCKVMAECRVVYTGTQAHYAYCRGATVRLLLMRRRGWRQNKI
jgi:hypothetical protein